MFDLDVEDDLETFVPVRQCAAQMGIGEDRVRQLAKLRVLRTRFAYDGDVLVQPAVVPGWT